MNSNHELNLTTIRDHQLKHILCPLDLVSDNNQALRYAAILARLYNAKLCLYHCAESSLPDGGLRARESMQQLLEPLLSHQPNQFEYEIIITEGKVGPAIIQTASDNEIDLIVMNSRRRPFTAALLGSTAEFVCNAAPCPVMVMHPHKREWIDSETDQIHLQRVLVAYDYSAYANLTLMLGLSLAHEYRAELHLLSVKPIKSERSWTPLTALELMQETEKLRGLLPNVTDFKLKSVVAEGEPYDEILKYAESNHIDLICIGAHSSKKSSLFGNTANRVLREATMPVLVARPLQITPHVTESAVYQRILIATDGSNSGEAAVRAARERNWPAGVELRVISVLEPLSTMGPATTHYQLPTEVYEALTKVASDTAARLTNSATKVSYIVREGIAAEQILAEAREWQAELIMVGTHSRQGLARLLLGSVAEQVALRATCSVEIVRQPISIAQKA